MDGVEPDIPLAAGLEDHICKAPLKQKAVVSVHQKVKEILQMWYDSRNTSLVVLFLFASRSYYKFRAQQGHTFAMRSTLQDLARDHYFLIVNDFGIGTPDLNKIHEVAFQERLILVGKKPDNTPSQNIEHEHGQISAEKLREYATRFDVRTGKRKTDGEPRRETKRRAPNS